MVWSTWVLQYRPTCLETHHCLVIFIYWFFGQRETLLWDVLKSTQKSHAGVLSKWHSPLRPAAILEITSIYGRSNKKGGLKSAKLKPHIFEQEDGIGQCPIFYRPPHFSAKTHAAIVTNVVNGLIKPFAITFRTTTEAVVVGLTSNSA